MHWSTACCVFALVVAGAAWTLLRRRSGGDGWRAVDPWGAQLVDRIHASADTLTKGSMLQRLPGSLEASLSRDLSDLTRCALPELAKERARWTRAVLERPGTPAWSAAAASLRASDANLRELVERLERLELELLAAPVGTGARLDAEEGERFSVLTAVSVSRGIELLVRDLPGSAWGATGPVSLYRNGLEA